MDFENLKHFPAEFLYGVLAVMGGCARYLNSFASGKPFKLSIFLASAFVAGFSGYMFAVLGETMAMPSQMLFVMAGIGGFFGEQTMKLILEYTTGKIH